MIRTNLASSSCRAGLQGRRRSMLRHHRPYLDVLEDRRLMTASLVATGSVINPGPVEGAGFVPVGMNANKPLRLACFKRVVELHREASAQGEKSGTPGGTAWLEIIWQDRKCPKWSQYESGISPRDQLAEDRARQFAQDIRSAESRLTRLALIVAVAIGILQLIVLTPDSIGCQLVKNSVGWTGALNWLSCR